MILIISIVFISQLDCMYVIDQDHQEQSRWNEDFIYEGKLYFVVKYYSIFQTRYQPSWHIFYGLFCFQVKRLIEYIFMESTKNSWIFKRDECAWSQIFCQSRILGMDINSFKCHLQTLLLVHISWIWNWTPVCLWSKLKNFDNTAYT